MDMDAVLSLQSSMEQADQSLVHLAEIYGNYFRTLRKAGFTRSEALEMTLALQELMIGAAKQG